MPRDKTNILPAAYLIPQPMAHLKIAWVDGDFTVLPFGDESIANECAKNMNKSPAILSATILTPEELEDERKFRELAAPDS